MIGGSTRMMWILVVEESPRMRQPHKSRRKPCSCMYINTLILRLPTLISQPAHPSIHPSDKQTINRNTITRSHYLPTQNEHHRLQTRCRPPSPYPSTTPTAAARQATPATAARTALAIAALYVSFHPPCSHGLLANVG
ncbi:uncharacterized protein EKO05_0000254 [Ascochyta rabiei]|uniref:uncharacterized protein n=1 Tax=Didymella rabiei TaxID=5454 RepID=UPI00220F97E8|nr:uncharacterized protein EKO05_0000254 [Ascochyta rabiei]UPX09567.1 hypothetical protein EKO05_0000254 [Ascochyta rabiei]